MPPAPVDGVGGLAPPRRRYTFLDLEPAADLDEPAREEDGAAPGPAAPRSAPPGLQPSDQPVERRTEIRSRDRVVRPGVYRTCDTVVVSGMLVGAFLVSNLGAMPTGLEEFLTIRLSLKNLLLFVGFMVAWRIIAWLCGLYQPEGLRTGQGETPRVLCAVTAATAVAVAFPLSSASGAFGYPALGLFWVGVAVTILAERRASRWIAQTRRRDVRYVLIVGSGPRALEMESRLASDPRIDYRVVGFVDADAKFLPNESRSRLVARLEDFEETLMYSAIDEVVVALPVKSYYAEIQRIVGFCESIGVAVTLPANPFQSSRVPFRPRPYATMMAMTLDDGPRGFGTTVKRLLDVVGAVIGIVVLGPLMLLTAVTIKLTSRGPVLFVQPRYGYNRRIFRMYKFRTMVANAETLQSELEHLNEAAGPLFKISDDPRLTPMGRALRRSSIDELPQLFNVLKGEMSMVGPRPMAIRDVGRFSESTLMRRFSVRPGLTGLWQVSGRCALDSSTWAKLDLRYIEEWSLRADLKILLRTVPAVLRGTGAR
jgi:exopolysaccharide biosynthesis polyprenyl glycosylphosphotransferase